MNNDGTKICRFCGEEVRAKAIKCRYCHSILDEKAVILKAEMKTADVSIHKAGADYEKEAQNRDGISQILPMFLQTAVGIIILMIVWLIIVNLPMLEEMSFPLDFTITEMLAAAVLTIIISMLISFGMRIEVRLSLLTTLPQGGTMAKQIFFLIAILIAYFAYKPIVVPYLGDIEWLYHLLFLIVFLTILAILVSALYRNIEYFTGTFTSSKLQGPSAAKVLECVQCGGKNAAGFKYCSFCGEKMPQPRECRNCGNILKQDAKFCPHCGEVAEANGSGNESIQKVVQKPVCSSCSEPFKEGAKFCTSCGQPRV